MISFSDAEVFLPKYLSPESRKQLYADIQKFDGINYYCKLHDPEPLQGDGWSQVDFVDIEQVSKRSLNALILSNSCDLTAGNGTKLPGRITVSPLIRLSRLEAVLKASGISEQQITDFICDVKKQLISNAFFLPASDALNEDSVVFFDNVQSSLLANFDSLKNKARIFSLSQFAFWLLLIKLAIHFCRAQEGILRTNEAKQ